MLVRLTTRLRKPIALLVVAVEGVQTNKWSSSYQSQGRCDPSGEAHGTEVVRFASRRAARTSVVAKPYFHLAGYTLPLRVLAKVTRHGVQTTQPTPPECELWDLRSGYFIGSQGGLLYRAAGKKVEKRPDLGIDRTATVDWTITFHRIENDV
jgi:hypothetical protein